MVISGILAAAAPAQLESAKAAVSSHAWAKVHQEDAIGRFVLTIEADSTDEAMDRLQVIQRLPELLMAEMVEHWFEEEGAMRPLELGEHGHDLLYRPVSSDDFRRKGSNKH